MPRSLLLHNPWRVLFAALAAVALLLCTFSQADAQRGRRRRPAQTQQTGNDNTAATPGAPSQPAKKNLAALRTGEGPEGGRATITSDAPLNDYEAYRSGNRYYVVIPQASAPSVPGNARGRGFDDVQVHKRGNDTVLSFRLKPGTTAHVNQKFNRLEVVFNAPSDSASGSPSTSANNSNTPAGTQNPVTGAGNSNQRTGSESPAGTPQSNANTGQNVTTPTITPGANSALTGNEATTAPPNATASPAMATLPPVTPALGPTGAETPATADASPTPPTDQIAQAQSAPSTPTSAVTTTPATSGTSLGAVLKSNWLAILIAALVLIGIGLVVMTRSRARRGPSRPERRIADQESKAALAEATPEERAEAAVPVAARDQAVDADTIGREAVVVPVVAATATDEAETIETQPAEAFNVERVRLEIKHVLTGEPYDETVINSPVPEARQLIESEFLFALSKRHTERRNRALQAFTQHGYFDDVTRDLRTADVAIERAQAARKLGLTRDTASTPHLVAALEDPAPEVRRAAVEALTELQDPEAVAPLEALLKREEDRKVPYALIQRAIRASSMRPAEVEEKAAAKPARSAPAVEVAPEQAVVEEAAAIEAEPVSVEESEAPVVESAAVATESEAVTDAAEPLASAHAATDDETPTLEAVPQTQAEETEVAPVEEASELSHGAMALTPVVVEGITTAEAEAAERRRAETEAARIHAEQEAQRRIAEEERQRAEEESLRRRVEEAARLRAEAEREKLAEEARLKEEERRAEEERLRLEEERRRAEEEERRLEEERRAEEERLRVEAEARRAEEERLRFEEEQRLAEERQRAEEERRRVEEEQRRAEEEQRRAEAERLRLEEEERRAEEERRREEERQRLEEERLRAEAEAQRQREEAEAARLRAEEERQQAEAERLRAEEEQRRAEEEERLRAQQEREGQEEEARLRLVEEERERLEEARRQRAEERERRRAEEERARLEAEERERSEADAARRRAEEAAKRLAEMRRRMEEEARRREEAEAERLRLEEEARQRAEEEAERLRAEEEEAAARQQQEEERRAEEERLRIEAEARRAEEEERQRVEEERRIAEERRRAEAEFLRTEEEERLRAEQARLYEEEERKRVEEEARQREEAEAARVQFEREAAERRLREKAEYASFEVEPTEPFHTEPAPPTVQSDLFEATFTEPQPFTPSAEMEAEPVEAAADWIDVDITETEAVLDEQPAVSAAPHAADEAVVAREAAAEEEAVPVKVVEEYAGEPEVKEVEPTVAERGIERAGEDFSSVPGGILRRLGSESADERAAAVSDLARVGGDDAFREISAAFDDPSSRVRDAAARALFDLHDDHAASFTRALREAPPERRRKIGNALATSGLASQAIGHLMGESREKTYDAFSLLFLMSKAGEVQPLMRAIEEHPNSEVRLAVVKLLALSGQQEILPAFRRLAVRGSLPTEVRSAVMEAIYQISSQASTDTSPVA